MVFLEGRELKFVILMNDFDGILTLIESEGFELFYVKVRESQILDPKRK